VQTHRHAYRDTFLQRYRQAPLDKDRAKGRAEPTRLLEELRDRRVRLLQALQVRTIAADLQRKQKCGGACSRYTSKLCTCGRWEKVLVSSTVSQ
jgi:hypothetical protein